MHLALMAIGMEPLLVGADASNNGSLRSIVEFQLMHQAGWLTGDIAGVAVEAVDGLRGAARNLKDFHSGVARRRQQLLVGSDFQLVYLPHRLSRASGDDHGQF